MEQVAREHGKILSAPLHNDLVLVETGLDSLDLAVLVARLEEKLGLNPFATSKLNFLPVTFGEFLKAYEDRAQ